MNGRNIVVTVEGRFLSFLGEKQALDDLFDKDFYTYSNSIADRFYNDSYGVNEIYDNVVQDYLALNGFVKNNSSRIDYVDVKKATPDVRFYLIDICRKNGVNIKGKKCLEALLTEINYSVYHFSSFLYLAFLMTKIPYTGEKIQKTKMFSVLRYPANFTKTKNFTEIYKEYENPYEKKSIYRFFPRIKRVGWVIKAYFESFKSLSKQKEFYRPLLGDWSVLALNNFYKKRIVHAELYKCLLEKYFPYFSEETYYSVYNLDRFSVIEDWVAHNNKIKTYNLPHGIEYGYKFPKGFSSDTFYALTEHSAKVLNHLYKTDKFVFDLSVASRLLKRENASAHEPHIVFFTEPREVNVNIDIIKGLTPLLKAKGWRLCLKLHPGDKKSDYDNLDVDILTDYNEALCGNVCISRKSTILLEAIYNDSVPISIITNVKDQTIYDNFPSLQSDKIIKTHTVEELMIEIEKNFTLNKC